MSERSTEQIREEIAAERQGLSDDLNALRAEALSLLPLVATGLAVIGLVAFRKGARTAVKLLFRLV